MPPSPSDQTRPLRFRALAALSDLSVRHPGWIVCIALVFALLSLGYTSRTLSIQTSTENMLDERLDFRQRHAEFRRLVPDLKSNIVIVIDAPTPELADEAAAGLSQQLRQKTEIFRHVFNPSGHPFFRRYGLLFLSQEDLDDVSIRLAQSQPLLAALARDPSLRGLFGLLEALAAADDRESLDLSAFSPAFDQFATGAQQVTQGQDSAISWQNLLSGDPPSTSYRRILLARPFLDYASLSPARNATQAIQSAVSELELDTRNNVTVRLTGNIILEQDELLSVREGATLSGIVAFFLVACLTISGLRSWRLIVATLSTLLLGLIWTAGYAALMIGHLNIISVAFAVLFIGIGIDFGIQYCLRYREKRLAGYASDRALMATSNEVAPALALATSAAAMGFLSFIPTDYIGLSELGQISAAGMGFALIANFTVLPALLTIFPLPLNPAMPSPSPAWGRGLWQRYVENLTPQKGRFLALVTLGITGGIVALGWGQLVFDYDPLNLKDPTTESYLTARELQSSNHSGYAISLLAESPQDAARMTETLRQLPVVSRVISPLDYVPKDQEDKLALIDDMALYLGPVLSQLPDPPPDDRENRQALARLLETIDARANQESFAQSAQPLIQLAQALRPYLEAGEQEWARLQTVFFRHFPSQLARLEESLGAKPFDLETLPPDFKRRLIARDGRYVVQVFPQEDVTDLNALSDFVEAVSTRFPGATDTPVLIYQAGRIVTNAFYMAALLSSIAISGLLFLVLRQWGDMALAIAPLLMAASLTLSLAGLSGIPLNFANMIAIPLIISLGVAYGLYILLRSREQSGIQKALMTSTPRAILFSALTTMGSFGSLALSPHQGTASMGILMMMALTLTLMSSFTLLPALLAWKEGNRS